MLNDVFLRYEKGNDSFDISFRYVDEASKVRQFNFSRQVAVSVNNFLKKDWYKRLQVCNQKGERNFLLFVFFFLLLDIYHYVIYYFMK